MDQEDTYEIFQIHYQGWKSEEKSIIEEAETQVVKSQFHLNQGLHRIDKTKPSERVYDSCLGAKKDEGRPIDSIPREKGNSKLEALLEEFESVFPADLPKNQLVDREISMRIPLKPGFEPPCQAPYRANHEAQEMIEKTVQYLVDH